MNTAENYKVKIQVFEGPLDLLLHLVKINEMDIQEIRISEITSQYLAYLRLMETFDLEIAGEFLVMAATLLNIKLRSLLPDSPEDSEEDEEVGDILTARMLMEKLIEYRKFKEAASELRDREERQARTFYRDVALPKISRAQQDDELGGDLDMLLDAFSRVLRFVEERGWHLVTEEEYAVEEKMDWLEERLKVEKRIDVESLFREASSKLEMIVYLLAMLELFHERRARVEQSEAFGPIYLFPPGERAVAAQSLEQTEPEPTPGPMAEIVDLEDSDEPLTDDDPQ